MQVAAVAITLAFWLPVVGLLIFLRRSWVGVALTGILVVIVIVALARVYPIATTIGTLIVHGIGSVGLLRRIAKETERVDSTTNEKPGDEQR